jgi:hypothetical protein
MYVWMNVCMYVCVCVYVCTVSNNLGIKALELRLYVCMYVCMCVCVCKFYVYAYQHYLHMWGCSAEMRVYACARTSTYVCPYTPKMHENLLEYLTTARCVLIHSGVFMCIHGSRYVYTFECACVRMNCNKTYMHVYIYIYT